MTGHPGLPVPGYTPQSEENVGLVTLAKQAEERVLRLIDGIEADPATDKRMVALARTNIQQGFMWLNRSVFQPERIALPEDSEPPAA